MKIVKVGFRRLRSFGEYENMGVEVEASVGENETPEQVFEELQKWGAQKLAEAIEMPAVSELQTQRKELTEDVERLRRECWNRSHEHDMLTLKIQGLRQEKLDTAGEEKL